MNRNWILPEKLAGKSQDLEAVLFVTVEKDGSIKEMWFEKRSGKTEFDQSAQRAVILSNPLPPLPEKYAHAHMNVGLVFRPPAGPAKGF